jgi:hypothetical protein
VCCRLGHSRRPSMPWSLNGSNQLSTVESLPHLHEREHTLAHMFSHCFNYQIENNLLTYLELNILPSIPLKLISALTQLVSSEAAKRRYCITTEALLWRELPVPIGLIIVNICHDYFRYKETQFSLSHAHLITLTIYGN